MNHISNAISHLHRMDMESKQAGLLQDLHPLCKLLVTIAYLAFLVSFNKYDVTGVLLMGTYLIAMYLVGDISVRMLFVRMRPMLMLVLLLAMVNPFFDRQVLLQVGNIGITGGELSMVTLMLKGTYAVAGAYLLMVTTDIEDICRALRMLHVPEVLITVILLIYRYIIVFLKEVERIWEAYEMRAPLQRGVHFHVWGSMVGQLLLRSMDKAQTVYDSMLLRGYDGSYYLANQRPLNTVDGCFLIAWLVVFTVLRILL